MEHLHMNCLRDLIYCPRQGERERFIAVEGTIARTKHRSGTRRS